MAKKRDNELRLAEKIREIEQRYARSNVVATGFAGEEQNDVIETGWTGVDVALGGGLVRGALHEWFGLIEPLAIAGDEATKRRSDGAGSSPAPGGDGALADSTGRVRSPQRTKDNSVDTIRGARRGRWTPPVCVLVHLARQALHASNGMEEGATPRGLKPAAQERENPCGRKPVDREAVGASTSAFWAVWVGKRCFPYPGVLVRAEDDDRCLLERSMFVAPRDAASRLWAIDLALRSPVVGVVVADGSHFDMAATRRVQLVAKANGTCVLLVRPPWELQELSAAQSRWLVRREPFTNQTECARMCDANQSPKRKRRVRQPRAGAWGSDEHDPNGIRPLPDGRGTDYRCENPFSHPRRVFGERARAHEAFAQSETPRWSVQLLRCKGVQPGRAHGVWALEWNRATGTVGLSTAMVDPSRDPQEATANTHRAASRPHRSA